MKVTKMRFVSFETYFLQESNISLNSGNPGLWSLTNLFTTGELLSTPPLLNNVHFTYTITNMYWILSSEF